MEFETTIALDRNHARSFFRLGQTLMFLGRPEEGIPHIEKAIRFNPRDPNIARPYAILGQAHLLLAVLTRRLTSSDKRVSPTLASGGFTWSSPGP